MVKISSVIDIFIRTLKNFDKLPREYGSSKNKPVLNQMINSLTGLDAFQHGKIGKTTIQCPSRSVYLWFTDSFYMSEKFL